MRSAACASVSVALPSTGLAVALGIATATPAFLPASAGPWKCAAVAGPDRPLYVSFQLNFFDAASYSRSAVPLPALVFGGTSDLLSSVAFILSAARAGPAKAIAAPSASVASMVLVIGSLPVVLSLKTARIQVYSQN